MIPKPSPVLGFRVFLPPLRPKLCSQKFQLPQRVQVLNNEVLEFGVIVIIVQVLGKSIVTRYLDP